jgi:hypothetical protein
MNWTKLSVATTLAAALIASSATAYADCGDLGRDPCTGPVPTVDQVVAIMAELTDPNRPAASKNDIVTPRFSPDEAGAVDDHLHRTNDAGLLPYNFVVTDIVSAPANFAGVTVTVTGSFNQQSAPQHIVLADQGGHWLITHDSAWTTLNNFWFNATRRKPFVPGNSISYLTDDPAPPSPPPGETLPMPLPPGTQFAPPDVEVYCPNLVWVRRCHQCAADPAHQCWDR